MIRLINSACERFLAWRRGLRRVGPGCYVLNDSARRQLQQFLDEGGPE